MQSLLNVLVYVQICVVNENDLHVNINVYISHMKLIQILDRYVQLTKHIFVQIQIFFQLNHSLMITQYSRASADQVG